MCPFGKGWINPTSSYGHVGPMGCFDHQSLQGVWQRYQGELAGALGVNALPDNELTRRVLKVSWRLEMTLKSTTKIYAKKRGENRVFCHLRCLGGSRLNLRKYELPPTGKKTSNLESEDFFWNIIHTLFIFMLISRFWRVYHPHRKKVKGFFKNPMKDLWHLGWILGRPAVDHRAIFRLHHHENIILKMDDVKIIYSNNGWYECQKGMSFFVFMFPRWMWV